MNRTARWAAGALTLASAIGTTLLAAPAASAALPEPPSFACPAGSDSFNVPNRIVAPTSPVLTQNGRVVVRG